MMTENLLSQEQVDFFRENGYILIESFYNKEKEIEPIQKYIHSIIGILIKKHNLDIKQDSFSPETFDKGYLELIKYDPKIREIVYDSVKEIPAFVKLIASDNNIKLASQIMNSDLVGIPRVGNGIRIDNPYEEKFMSDWHQEYPYQFKSLDGLVFWTPLVEIVPELGPVILCKSSHKNGLQRLHTVKNINKEKPGAYSYVMENKNSVISLYEKIEPLSKPSDLIIIDYLTLHASGYNSGNRPRWSMQIRYFNFNNPIGIKIDWKGGVVAGVNIKEVHPELYID